MKHVETEGLGETVEDSSHWRAARRRWPGLRFAAVVAMGALAMSACSGGASASDDGVASIEGDGSDDNGSAAESATSAEEQLLDYVECLRREGLDVPDPQVDADGNLVLDPDELFPGGDGEQASQAEIDAFNEKYQAAQGVCGPPPEGAVGGFDHGGDQTDFEDALVAFARCMRENGVDIADPDFSTPGGKGEFFSEFHRIETEPAFEECQQEAFGSLGSSGG